MAKKSKPPIIPNKFVRHDYDLLDVYKAGIVLTGAEVKSVRLGNANLKGAYVNFVGGELWLINAYIAPYSHAKLDSNYDPNRSRKLLLNKNELLKLTQTKIAKLSIVPTKLLTAGRHVKLEIASARGLKKHDKRQKLIKEAQNNEAKRALTRRSF